MLSVQGLDAGFGVEVLPLGAVAFGAVTAEEAEDDGGACAGDEDEGLGDDSASDVGDEEDDDSCIHEDGEHNSKVAFRHGAPRQDQTSASVLPDGLRGAGGTWKRNVLLRRCIALEAGFNFLR